MSKYEFVEGEEFTKDDIKVLVTYEDGFKEVVTNYESNIDEIDMKVPGVKELTITYGKVTEEILIVVTETPEDDSDDGEGKFEVIQGEGAPEMSITNADLEALAEALLTDEEKALIEAEGVDYKIYLEVETIENVSDADKEAVNSYIKENLKLGAYIDISLYTKVGNNSATKITNPGELIEITIVIPEELRVPSEEYYIVRVHENEDGTIEKDLISGIFNEDEQTFTFVTDKFSTYAIIYSDVENNVGDDNNGDDNVGDDNNGDDNVGDDNNGNDNVGDDNNGDDNVGDDNNDDNKNDIPKTGDDAEPFVWSVALLFAISALGVCVKKVVRKRR